MECKHEKAELVNFGCTLVCWECNNCCAYGYDEEASLNCGANVRRAYGEWRELNDEIWGIYHGPHGWMELVYA